MAEQNNRRSISVYAEIKTKASLCEEIETRGIVLKRSGIGKMRTRCPFHADQDPSFFVYLEIGGNEYETYYCFGCKKHGDVIDFVKEYDKTDTGGALKYFSKKYDIPLFDGESHQHRIIWEETKKKSKISLFPFLLEVSDMTREYLKKSNNAQSDLLRMKDYLQGIDESVYNEEKGSLNLLRKSFKCLLAGLKDRNEKRQGAK